ncbi:MAG: glycosyltransferase family protein [Candidatus Limnocylindrales bacterium]
MTAVRVPTAFDSLDGAFGDIDAEPRLRRLLLYSHDTYGLGHLRRNLAIASYLLRTTRQLQIVLLTGSPAAERFPLPRGLSLVRLPSVVKVAPEEYAARDAQVSFGILNRVRAAIIADVARRFQPDAVLVDHAPIGMKGELLPMFEALRRHVPEARIVLGLRDVLDDPAVVRRTWSEQGVLDTLEHVYDRVLVYGSHDILDVASAYGIPERLRSRVSYCGYVARDASRPHILPTTEPLSGPYVLGTAGGGEDGVPVLQATLRAASALCAQALLVTGPLMRPGAREELAAEAAMADGIRVVEFVPDLERVMTNAAAIVTMGGYNTLCEAVGSGVPTVVIPRTWPRREQAIRAELFADRGLVRIVEPGDDLAERLVAPLRAALADRRRVAPGIDLDGASRVRLALLEEVARPASSPAHQVHSLPRLRALAASGPVPA